MNSYFAGFTPSGTAGLVFVIVVSIPIFIAIGIIWWVLNKIFNKTVGKKYPNSTVQPKKFYHDSAFWLMAVPAGGVMFIALAFFIYSLF